MYSNWMCYLLIYSFDFFFNALDNRSYDSGPALYSNGARQPRAARKVTSDLNAPCNIAHPTIDTLNPHHTLPWRRPQLACPEQ